MNATTQYETELAKEYDHDLIDPITFTVTGDEPPAELGEAVHEAITETILHLLDGREGKWTRVDGERGPHYLFEIHGGMPEMPHESGAWLAPYRTREKFEGADGSGDGLMGYLPDGWAFEVERGDSVFGFYQVS